MPNVCCEQEQVLLSFMFSMCVLCFEQKSFTVHPSPRSIVTRLVRCGDGVWVCGRRDSTLRLFNAVTREHVQVSCQKILSSYRV